VVVGLGGGIDVTVTVGDVAVGLGAVTVPVGSSSGLTVRRSVVVDGSVVAATGMAPPPGTATQPPTVASPTTVAPTARTRDIGRRDCTPLGNTSRRRCGGDARKQ
jgi:hypothetical protein